MKKFIILICLTILCKPVLPVVEYIVNYDYIKNEMCVNKAIPIMGCNGKCYLISELAKSSEFEKPTSEKKTSPKPIETLFFQPLEKLIFDNRIFNYSSKVKWSYCNLYTFLKCKTTFHPPTFIC
jgi:hypothetical protein